MNLKDSTKLGRLLAAWHSLQEKFRIKTFVRDKELEGVSIFSELVFKAKPIPTLLFVFILVAIFLDLAFHRLLSDNYIPQSFLDFLSFNKAIQLDGLIIGLLGAISALLGLLIALYSLAFQITVENYSDDVVDYLNEERVTKQFFQLQVFTAVFLLITIVRLMVFSTVYPVGFLVLAFLFSCCSILGLFVVKSHFLLSTYPKKVFLRLYGELYQSILLLEVRRSNIHKSRSLSVHIRNQIRKLISIYFLLIKDLVHKKKYEEANYGISLIGDLLVRFLDSKNFYDREVLWWSYNKYEQLNKRNELSMYPVKAHFEAHGIGPYQSEVPQTDWLEEYINSIKEWVIGEVNKGQSELLPGLMQFYLFCLSGNFGRTLEGVRRDLPSLKDIQELDLYEKYLVEYFDLVSKDVVLNTYWVDLLNTLNGIRILIVDGFNIRQRAIDAVAWMPGFREVINTFLITKRPIRAELDSLEMPKFFKEVLVDFWERTQLEIEVEGKIVTPIEFLTEEITSVVLDKENSFKKKISSIYFDRLFILLEKSQESSTPAVRGELFRMYFMSLQQLHYLNDSNFSVVVSKLKNINLKFLISTDFKELERLDLFTWLEKVLFASLKVRDYDSYCVLFRIYLSLSIKIRKSLKDDTTEAFRYTKRFLILCGFIYLCAEFYQDRRFLHHLVSRIEEGWFLPVSMVKIIEVMSMTVDSSMRLGIFNTFIDEFNRYRPYFNQIYGEMEKLSKIEDEPSLYRSLRYKVDHPSRFIQKQAEWGHGDPDDSIEPFIEYLKRREAFKEVISIIKLKHERKI